MTFNNSTNTPKLTADGQLFIGRASGNPLAALLTAGANITITNSSGGIQIAAASAGTLSTNQVAFLTPGSFTYTPSAGTIFAFVQVLGAGGAGGGVTNSGANDVIAGSGGGGGGYTEAYISIGTIGASQTVTVGAGGTGVSSMDGNPGTLSSFGAFLVANPGLGGLLGVAEAGFGAGGSGGGYGGALVLYGYAGQTGGASGPPSGASSGDIPPFGYAGYGGSCFTGRQNEGYGWSVLVGAVSTPGEDETEYGGGGSGAFSAISSAPNAGGDGAGGSVLVTEWIIT